MTRAITSQGAPWADLVNIFRSGDVARGMIDVANALNELRAETPADAWRDGPRDTALLSLRAMLHEDPYTRRGYQQPRGYAGDAVLLDYIYGVAPLPERISPLGRAIYDWCDASSPAWRSVRARRVRLGQEIDRIASDRKPRVLAVGAGHLREAVLSEALVNRRVSEIVALDHDAESLRVVARSLGGLPVRCLQGRVIDLLRRRVALGDFDLVYAAGIYDYLSDDVARAVTHVLASMLRPGGRLLIANFSTLWERGYIEAMMRWFLIYRQPSELSLLAAGLDGASIAIEHDAEGTLAYLVLDRES